MKTRTKILAVLFLVYSAYSAVVLLHLVLFGGSGAVRVPMLWTVVLLALPFPLWIALLRRQIWAWWLLVAYFGFYLLYASERTLVYFVGEPASPVAVRLVTTILGVAVFGLLPAWMLLTDRPRMWNQTPAEQEPG